MGNVKKNLEFEALVKEMMEYPKENEPIEITTTTKEVQTTEVKLVDNQQEELEDMAWDSCPVSPISIKPDLFKLSLVGSEASFLANLAEEVDLWCDNVQQQLLNPTTKRLMVLRLGESSQGNGEVCKGAKPQSAIKASPKDLGEIADNVQQRLHDLEEK